MQLKTKDLSPEELALSDSLIDEIVGAVGLPKTRLMHKIFWLLTHGITNKMAVLGVPFNQIIGEKGLPAGCSWGASNFCTEPNISGIENIVTEGPLLIPMNHPGTYDALIVISQLNRDDVKIITTEIPFFELLPNACEHMLFTSRTDNNNRIKVMRAAVRHLNAGGALVYIGAGHREPDPAVYPGAKDSLTAWLDIYNAFFRFVPYLRVMPAIVSGVITDRWARHPLSYIRRDQIDRQRLSEFFQVINQLYNPGKHLVTPNLSFGESFSEAELRSEMGSGIMLEAVVSRVTTLMKEHCDRFYDGK